MMNSKTLALAVFAIWSVICWRWYVCGLMDACGDNPNGRVNEEVVAVPDDRPMENLGENSGQLQADNSKEITAPASEPKTSRPVSPEKMEEVQMEEVEDRMVIYFPYKSTRKEDNAAIDAYLANLARQLSSSGEKVSITGHTDFVGEPAANYNFGLRRAYGIRDILVKKGVPKSQIRCKSLGDRKPVATNDTPYGRYLNRRVEIRIGN